LEGHDGEVRGIAWSADDSLLETLAEEAEFTEPAIFVTVWDYRSGRQFLRLELPHSYHPHLSFWRLEIRGFRKSAWQNP
jgi:WD40 repeat protein